jgi:hypothetical protein
MSLQNIKNLKLHFKSIDIHSRQAADYQPTGSELRHIALGRKYRSDSVYMLGIDEQDV